MSMIADMILAVAMVAIAPGAVPEFQVRVRHISPAADGTFVGIGGFDRGGGGLVGAGAGEGDYLRAGFGFALSSEEPLGIEPPADGEDIQHILAKEQEVIGQADDREQIGGEGIEQQTKQHDGQVKEGEDPGLHRDDEEQQETGIGVKGGVGQEQTQIEIVYICLTAEDKTVHIHHEDAGEVEQVEPESAPGVFHSPSQGIVADQIQKLVENIAVQGGQGIGEQPPNLALQDQISVEAQP